MCWSLMSRAKRERTYFLIFINGRLQPVKLIWSRLLYWARWKTLDHDPNPGSLVEVCRITTKWFESKIQTVTHTRQTLVCVQWERLLWRTGTTRSGEAEECLRGWVCFPEETPWLKYVPPKPEFLSFIFEFVLFNLSHSIEKLNLNSRIGNWMYSFGTYLQ